MKNLFYVFLIIFATQAAMASKARMRSLQLDGKPFPMPPKSPSTPSLPSVQSESPR